jgi:hypothetical protein
VWDLNELQQRQIADALVGKGVQPPTVAECVLAKGWPCCCAGAECVMRWITSRVA